MKWVIVAVCIDTPNAIAAAIESARIDHPGKTLWVKSEVNGEYIP